MRYENIIKSEKDYYEIKKATEISVEILRALRAAVKEGVSPKDMDDLAGELCARHKVRPSFLGVQGIKSQFPSNLCIMVNDEAVHAIPSSENPFKEGDLVKVDFGVIYNGWNTDHGITLPIGEVSERRSILKSTVDLSVDTAIQNIRAGVRSGDISYVLEDISSMSGFGSVKDFGGHGIGKNIHYSPSIPFVGDRGEGERIEENMLLCIENWITEGSPDLLLEGDGWTLKTKDGSYSAMMEHMVIVRKDSAEILTLLD